MRSNIVRLLSTARCHHADGRRQYAGHNPAGSLLAEAAMSMLLMIPSLALCLNAVFGLMAYQSLDGGCRDAARAAAQVAYTWNANPNLTPAQQIAAAQALAQQAANAAVQLHSSGPIQMTAQVINFSGTVWDQDSTQVGANSNEFYLSDPQGNLVPPDPQSGNYYGPSVTVKTTMTYTMPFPMPTFSQSMSSGGQTVTLQQVYSYPLLNPYLIGGTT